MIVALTESSSPRRLGTTPRMVSKADRSYIIVSNDVVKRNLFSIAKLIIIWLWARPLVLGAARVKPDAIDSSEYTGSSQHS